MTDRGAGLRARQVALLNQYVGPDMTGEPTLLFPGSAEDLLDRLTALIDSEELDAATLGRAVHRVFNHGLHGGGHDDADSDIGHALAAEYARLTKHPEEPAP